VCFYCDGEISEEDKELCECVLDEIHSDFIHLSKGNSKFEFETPFIRLDYPHKPPLIGHWVYYRNEDTSKYI